MKLPTFSRPSGSRSVIAATVLFLFHLSHGLAQTLSVTVSPQAQPSYRGDVVTFQGTIVNNGSTKQLLNGDNIALALNSVAISGVTYDLFTDDTDYVTDFSTGAPISLGPGAQWTGNLFQVVIGPDAPFTTYAGSFSVLGGVDQTGFGTLGSGSFQLTVIDIPPNSGPAAPSNLTGQALAFDFVKLRWNDNSDNEAGFGVEESTDGSNFSPIGTTGANVTTYQATGLQAGGTYYFRVRAYNTFNGSTYSAYTNVVTLTTPTLAPSLNFSTGFASSGGPGGLLQYNGSATIAGSRLRLTDGGSTEASSVYGKAAQTIQRFDAEFTFQLTNPNAEGFTFCIQSNSSSAIGQNGGSLGYASIAKSVAIKFDLFSDNGETANSTGLYLNGAVPENVGSIDLTSSGINLHSGDTFAVAIVYDGTTLTEILTDTNTGASFVQPYAINVAATIGSPTAYVGFTGSTGAQTATQDILAWTFVSLATAPPASPSGLTARAVSNSEIDLSWIDNSNNASGFVVQRSADDNVFSQVFQTVALVTSYRDTGLAPGSTYFYRIYAVNGVGESGFTSTVQASTPASGGTQSGGAGLLSGANLLRYALTGNTIATPSPSSSPITTIEGIGGSNHLTLSVVRPSPAPEGISYHIECTSNLSSATWTPAIVMSGYPMDNGNGTETLKAEDSQPVSAGSQRFIRLRVTQP